MVLAGHVVARHFELRLAVLLPREDLGLMERQQLGEGFVEAEGHIW